MLKGKYIKLFWNKVDKTMDCWNWIGHITEKGYGKYSIAKGTIYNVTLDLRKFD